MTCEYFLRIEGDVFCRIYGKLKASNKEKILECETSFFDCFETASRSLNKGKENNTYRGCK